MSTKFLKFGKVSTVACQNKAVNCIGLSLIRSPFSPVGLIWERAVAEIGDGAIYQPKHMLVRNTSQIANVWTDHHQWQPVYPPESLQQVSGNSFEDESPACMS